MTLVPKHSYAKLNSGLHSYMSIHLQIQDNIVVRFLLPAKLGNHRIGKSLVQFPKQVVHLVLTMPLGVKQNRLYLHVMGRKAERRRRK